MLMFQHDTLPALTITCTDNGAAVDLSTATSIKVIGTRADTGATVFSRAVTGTAQGVVTMTWLAADTANVGEIQVEVEVTWPTGVQTFRPSNNVQIVADLG